MARNAQRRFSGKKFGSFKNGKNIPKIKVFWTMLENGSNDIDEIHSESSAHQYLSARENRLSKKILVLDNFKIEFGSFSRCDDTMGNKSQDMCLYLADMSRYEDKALNQRPKAMSNKKNQARL